MTDQIKKMQNDPYSSLLGIRLVEVKKGYALCSAEIRDSMLNFLGVIHGGFVFSLADAAFAAASNFENPLSFALDISGSFLKTAKPGDILKAEAKLVHTTKRTGFYKMEVFNDNDMELVAVFNGTVFRKTS
ncbi:MAG: hotdog fold thioesterase [Desulfobacteraceae bacterium]|nr:hotdog fold thioesterase [Desulfobacteraceae bacterium]